MKIISFTIATILLLGCNKETPKKTDMQKCTEESNFSNHLTSRPKAPEPPPKPTIVVEKVVVHDTVRIQIPAPIQALTPASVESRNEKTQKEVKPAGPKMETYSLLAPIGGEYVEKTIPPWHPFHISSTGKLKISCISMNDGRAIGVNYHPGDNPRWDNLMCNQSGLLLQIYSMESTPTVVVLEVFPR